jgi:hypothetical protein
VKIWPVLLVSMGLPLGSFAAPITTLFNTGVNALGAPLADGSIDPHYADTIPADTVFVIPQNGAWASAGAAAKYVAPDTNQGGSFNGGSYTLDYVTSFNLTGFDPLSVLINGQWSTDNFGVDIFVNGHSTGHANAGFNPLTSFTLSGGSGFFTSGINSLDFRWGNGGGPGGLAVIFTSATANPAAVGVPEPVSLILLAAGLAILAVSGHRRRSRQH